MSNSRKKVIAINSSKRKKNTYGVLCNIAEKLEPSNIDVEILNLYDYEIKDCIGCEHCILESNCVLNDDVEMLMQKLICCDGIILSSPVYMGTISGKMKTFIDRTCRWYHRPELVGKPAILVSTTAGSYVDYTLDYLQRVAIQWGLHPTKSIGRKISTINIKVGPDEYKSFVKHLNMSPTFYKPVLKQLISFQVQKVLALKILDIDREYWQTHNWDRQMYFYDCNMSLINRQLACLFYRFMYHRVKRV